MEKPLTQFLCGQKFCHLGKVYLKCRSTIAQVAQVRHQVLAVNVVSGEIVSFFEKEVVSTIQ